MSTPADRLLAAADLLDKRAGEATEGPWTPHYGSDLHTDAAAWIGAPGRSTKDGVYVAETANAVEGLGDATYIATMQPEVGKALAKVFRAWAKIVRYDQDLIHRIGGEETLALADLLLAGAP